MKNQEQFQLLVIAAYDEYISAARVWWDARRDKAPPVDIRIAHWQMTESAEKYNALQASARDAFAKSRGWCYGRKRHPAPYVQEYGHLSRRIIKNQDVFRDARRRIVGVITHSAATLDEITAYAERHGLNATPLPYSWDAPDYHTAVLLTPKAAT